MSNQIDDYVQNRNKGLAYLVSLDVQHMTEKYTGAVNNYNRFVDEVGTDPGDPAPSVPIGPVVSPPDPVTGLVSIIEKAAPVCDPLPISRAAAPVVKVPNTIDIGRNIGGKWFSVGPRDTMPSGATTPPQADGHVYEKYGAPVGAGWYLQLS